MGGHTLGRRDKLVRRTHSLARAPAKRMFIRPANMHVQLSCHLQLRFAIETAIHRRLKNSIGHEIFLLAKLNEARRQLDLGLDCTRRYDLPNGQEIHWRKCACAANDNSNYRGSLHIPDWVWEQIRIRSTTQCAATGSQYSTALQVRSRLGATQRHTLCVF